MTMMGPGSVPMTAAPRRTAGPLRALPYSIAAAALCGFWLLLQFILGADSPLRDYALFWGRMPLLLLACYVGWHAVRANRAQPRAATAWGLMTAAIAVLIPADIYNGWLTLILGISAAVSVFDIMYLAYFPLMLSGLLVLPRGFEGRLDIQKFVIDAAIITLGGGLRLVYCDNFDIGFGAAFAVTDDHWAEQLYRTEVRLRY